MDPSVTCCFSGHRPAKLPWGENEQDPRCAALKLELSARLEGILELGYRHFLCGMAAGCDLYFAEAVLALREWYPDLVLEAAVPCDGQADGWSAVQRRPMIRSFPAATWSASFSTPTRPAACRSATAIWWTAPPCCWPVTTGTPAGRGIPSCTRCSGAAGSSSSTFEKAVSKRLSS